MAQKIAIINRNCCKGKNSAYIIRALKEKFSAEVTFTECAGYAETIAKNSSGYNLIIVAGGDGTISEVLNGMDLESQSLALIPIGTGNSLARDLEITSPIQAMELIEKNKLLKIDLIECQFEVNGEMFKRYAVATSGVGFSAATAVFANRYLKSTGAFCYPGAATFNLFGQKPIKARIQIDGFLSEDIEFTNFLINNTKHSGNLCIFPTADFKDSLLNLLFAKNNALNQYLWNLAILTRTYFYKKGVKKLVNKLSVILSKPALLMLDGEIFGLVKNVSYSVMPKGLKVLS